MLMLMSMFTPQETTHHASARLGPSPCMWKRSGESWTLAPVTWQNYEHLDN